MLALSDRRGRLMSSHSRARLQVCHHLSSADRMGSPRLEEIHLPEDSDQAPLKATQVQTLDATTKCLQKHLHSAVDHSWNLNPHRCPNAVLSALTMKELHFRHRRPHRRLLWKYHPDGDRKTSRIDSSPRLEMDQPLRRGTYHHRDPHHLQHRRFHRPHLRSCPSLRPR